MTDLDRRPTDVAVPAVDWEAALRYLQLNPKDPRAQALVMVCDRYGLDPLLGHVSLYDGKPYVHFAAYLHIANADSHFDGIECVREWNDDTYYWATVRVHRDDRNFPSERTGKSRKLKPKKGGGTYEDDTADAKAFAQAARRALRMAFNVDAPEPGEDGHETPPPEPVVEVARMVEATSQTGGAGGTGGPALAGQPAPSEMSGAGEREPTISPDSRDLRHDPAPDPTSDPWGLSPRDPGSDPPSSERHEFVGRLDLWCERCQRPDRDPIHTSPPPVNPGKVEQGWDSNSSDSEPEAGEAIPSDDEGEGSEGSGEHVPGRLRRHAKQVSDGTATTDPTPPRGSLTQQWCDENRQDMRIARVHLRRTHPDEFKDLKDWRDLNELEGERAALAVKRLDEWLANTQAHEGDK